MMVRLVSDLLIFDFNCCVSGGQVTKEKNTFFSGNLLGLNLLFGVNCFVKKLHPQVFYFLLQASSIHLDNLV